MHVNRGKVRCSTITIIFALALLGVLQITPARASDTKTDGHGPVPALLSLDDQGQMRISPEDRCPVCAMVPAKHVKTSCAIESKDGRTWYFCGTGCLIRTWLHPEHFLGVDKSNLARAVVRDFFNGEQLDADSVIWVAGSDVVGPMGPAIVPLKDKADVDAFRERHGGKHRFMLSEMTDELWMRIKGKPAIPPK